MFPNTDQSTIHKGPPSLISDIITERQQQLDAVLHEISGLETVMDGIKNLHQQLVKKKDRIIQSMNVHKGLVSALWRLPTEVLSQIFDHCLPVPEDSRLSSSSRLEAPMLLTEVCRRWREVAVGIPGLWCRLTVESTHGDWYRNAFCYDSWLKRSQGRPLSLTLLCYVVDYSEDRLRRLLQPYSNQISSLSIHFSVNSNKPELLLTDLLALQELTVSMPNLETRPALAQSISRLSTLRSLKITEPWFLFDHLSAFNPVWAHLTNVAIAIFQSSGVLRLLRLCPNLSSLMIRTQIDDIEAVEPFTHTKLQSLHISVPTHPLSSLFNALSLPNLRALAVRYIQTWPHEEFKALLVRSKCPLEYLNLGVLVMITDEQRAEYFTLIPSLKVVPDPNRKL
ncbi:hypothetical protein DFH29DRAFT_365883 [Suillus ampliporus]|nr:hypothetical protein DFH29DRAFT_365883 [Suillus ampliporus]